MGWQSESERGTRKETTMCWERKGSRERNVKLQCVVSVEVDARTLWYFIRIQRERWRERTASIQCVDNAEVKVLTNAT